MAYQVCSGPQGILTVTANGKMYVIGRARNINVTSDYQRDFVFGIGSVYPSEAPLIKWQGNVTVEQYGVITNKAILNAFDMTEQDNEKFFNYLFYEAGLDLLITQKRQINGSIVEVPIISLTKMFITSEGWTMQENQIWGRNGGFTLLEPPRNLGSSIPSSVLDSDVRPSN